MRIEVEGSAPPLAADAELLKIVFLNLLRQRRSCDGRRRAASGVSIDVAGGVVPRGVCRCGPGIPPEIREKIFTPFFTTKSRGTGLGLPPPSGWSRRTAARSGSSVPPSGGTTVTVELPLASGGVWWTGS